MIDVGKHCAVQNCNQLDFLPFKCGDCEKQFCQDHRYPNEHACQKLLQGKKEIDVHMVQQKADKCPAKGCKNILTVVNEFNCETCKKRVCLTHRFEDSHDCIAQKGSKPTTKAVSKPQKPLVEIQNKEDKPKKKSSFFCCFSGKPKNVEKKIKNKEQNVIKK